MTEKKQRVCALLPAYNEVDTIRITIESLRSRREIDKIIVVDDGSIDGTADAARAAGADTVIMQTNGGKGSALTAAYQAARDIGDIFLLLDSDLGASASESAKLLPAIFHGSADMTIGMLPPDPNFAESGQSGGLGLAVGLARWGIQRKTGREFRQPLSGQRAVRKEVLEKLGGRFATGFGVEVGLTIATISAGFTVLEVPTEFRHHVTGGDWAGIRHRARQFLDVARIVFTSAFIGV